MPKFHIIAGLPRSGSTLLSAILRQNPRFAAGMSSPVQSLVLGLTNMVSAGSEFGPVVSREQRRRMARAVADAYYEDKMHHDVIFDTNRYWPAHMGMVKELFPEAKVIACVRNLSWVLDSFERKYRANPFEATRMFRTEADRANVYARVEALMAAPSPVGRALLSLKDAFYGEHSESLLVVEYDLLARLPEKVVPLIYDFIGETPFAHDFSNVEFDAPEFDTAGGLSGLHKVRPKVELQPRDSVLPPELFNRYSQYSFWHDGNGSRAKIIGPPPPAAPAAT